MAAAIAALAGVLGAVSPADSVSAVRSVGPTHVDAVRPVTADGSLAAGDSVHRRYGGASCQSGSATIGHAYRCVTPSSPHGVYDPCWVTSQRHVVVCLVKPWLHTVVRLRVTGGYDDSAGFERVQLPWGARIGASRCLVILGPVHTIHGRTRNYLCTHRMVLAGRFRHPGRVWRIHAYRRRHRHGHGPRYRSLGVRPAATVWFGQPSRHD
jgi:hypothetical protein